MCLSDAQQSPPLLALLRAVLSVKVLLSKFPHRALELIEAESNGQLTDNGRNTTAVGELLKLFDAWILMARFEFYGTSLVVVDLLPKTNTFRRRRSDGQE